MVILTIFQVSCENNQKKYYALVGAINNAVHSGELSSIKEGMSNYSKFVESTKAYSSDSYLNEASLSQSVEFINCVESYVEDLTVKNKEKEELERWTRNLNEIKNPLNKNAEDSGSVIASIQKRLEGIKSRIREVDVILNKKRIKCDNSYSKLISLYKS